MPEATDRKVINSVNAPFPTSPRLVCGLVVFLLFTPLAVSGPVTNADTPLSVTWPMVHSGDEPHYLILINSIINDGDLDVANNYTNVHSGGHDAGRKFYRWPLDHHVTWYRGERLIHWSEAYETDFGRWNHDPAGNPVPAMRSGFDPGLTNRIEYCQHSPGIAFLLAPFLVPFRGTNLVECAALVCTVLVTAAGFFAFCFFVRPYVSDPSDGVLIGALAYLGSPLWAYGRTLFVEPYAATFVFCACTAVLRGNRYLLAGFLLSIVFLLKSPFALLTVPIVVEAIWRKEFPNALRTAIPLAISVCVSLWWNHLMWEGWFHLPQQWEWGNPLTGIFGLLFSVSNGIVLFAPVLIVSAFCVPIWFKCHRRDAIVVSATILGYFLQTSCYALWYGGHCYSARYMIPIVPLMFVPLAMLPKLEAWRRTVPIQLAVVCLVLISISFGFTGAFACENAWEKHPIQVMMSL